MDVRNEVRAGEESPVQWLNLGRFPGAGPMSCHNGEVWGLKSQNWLKIFDLPLQLGQSPSAKA